MSRLVGSLLLTNNTHVIIYAVTVEPVHDGPHWNHRLFYHYRKVADFTTIVKLGSAQPAAGHGYYACYLPICSDDYTQVPPHVKASFPR